MIAHTCSDVENGDAVPCHWQKITRVVFETCVQGGTMRWALHVHVYMYIVEYVSSAHMGGEP